MDDECGCDALQAELAAIPVSDGQVDRIYHAAHVAGGIRTHQMWDRKSYIGRMCQTVIAWRDRGITRESVREQVDAINRDNPMDTERTSAEFHRMNDLIYIEVYGPDEVTDE